MNRTGKLETWAAPSLIALTATIYIGSAGIPALLDDADSFYAEVAREMNLRHDWSRPMPMSFVSWKNRRCSTG